MNKTIINVPEGIKRLSNWRDFGKIIPEGWVILNKKVTGCGATTYFLDKDNHTPIILCSHRLELLDCKANSERHCRYVHLFKDALDKTSSDLSRNLARLHSYLDGCRNHTINGGELTIPKILVSTDSLRHVVDILLERNELQYFTLVSDEMQCIWTDAAFKGNSVLNYLINLKYFKNVIFISATPYLEKYLDEMDEFKDIPYIELNWSKQDVVDVAIKPFFAKSIRSVVVDKIRFFQEHGYFEESYYGRATQAIFYINSVTEIISIVRLCELDPDDVNIICSSTSESTKAKMKKAKLQIGHAQKVNEIHKTYTFITKCSFEGVDLYHTNAYTYIFSNPNLTNMALDLSIDIIQILGRQRLEENPWKNCASVYYLTTKEEFKISYDEFIKFQSEKEKMTRNFIEEYNNTEDPSFRQYKLKNLKRLNSIYPYLDDYLDIVTDKEGNVRVISNNLVRLSERRAWDIRNELSSTKYQVLNVLGSLNMNPTSDLVEKLEKVFLESQDFNLRLISYCDFRDNYKDLEHEVLSSIIIPREFHEYYNVLGTKGCRAASFRKGFIQRAVKDIYTKSETDFVKEVKSLFIVGNYYDKKYIKKELQKIYDKHGISKVAKATDLGQIFGLKSAIGPSLDTHERSNGFKILEEL